MIEEFFLAKVQSRLRFFERVVEIRGKDVSISRGVYPLFAVMF
jgi:hypothetical protein